jgi:outer membrane receptor protein involved in Fe transport
MLKTLLKTAIMKATFIALVGCISFSAHAVAETQRIEIPAGELVAALESLARQAEVDLVYSEAQVRGLKTAGVSGDLSAQEAIRRLLEGTALEVRTDEASGALLIAMPAVGPPRSEDRKPQAVTESSEVSPRHSFWDRFRVSQVDQGKAPGSIEQSEAASENNKGVKLEEIVVTAQKREERLQDVPVPVTTLDTNLLAERGQSRLQDYFASVPGLNLNANGDGTNTVAMRGLITALNATPTVGVTIDDVPFGSNSALSYGSRMVPDIDPADLARIEVLKGPQGTLYGASSIGGLLKFVTVDPSVIEASGRVQVDTNTVKNGELGYGIRGVANVPLSDVLAIRASGFARQESGFVDNVATSEKHVNQVDVAGGRVSALWRPSESVSLKLSAMLQNSDGDGTASIGADGLLKPILGDLQQSQLKGTGAYSAKTRLYTALLRADLAHFELTSVSAYNISKFSQLADMTPLYGPYVPLFFPTEGGASFDNHFETKKFSQEIRAASHAGGRWDWLAGIFYTHEDSPAIQTLYANDLATGDRVGLLLDAPYPTTLTEMAIFGDVTLHFTDRFDVQLGGRESQNKQVYNETDSGPFVPAFFGLPSPLVYPTEHTKESAFTYLVTPRFRISPELMVYARFASGYRAGGPNFSAILFNLPIEFNHDESNNYEVGVKGSLLNHALTFDVSAYYIDWKAIQLTLSDSTSGFAYFTNGGDAKSQGIELSIQARPTRGLTLGATASLNDAELADDLPTTSSVLGLSGDRLPYGSRFTGSLSIDQEVPLPKAFVGFLGGSVSYVGERLGEFQGQSLSAPRNRFPSYTAVNLRAGVRNASWTAGVYVNNATDERGIVGVGPRNSSTFNINFVQPRTIGVSLSRDF